MLVWLIAVAGATTLGTGDTGTAPTGTAPTDTGLVDPNANVDADLDGWTIGNGDCDDLDPDIHPGTPEVCEDRLDNDCDGLFDEECDDSVRLASLRGGGGCTGGGGLPGTQAVFIPLVFFPFLLWFVPSFLRRRP